MISQKKEAMEAGIDWWCTCNESCQTIPIIRLSLFPFWVETRKGNWSLLFPIRKWVSFVYIIMFNCNKLFLPKQISFAGRKEKQKKQIKEYLLLWRIFCIYVTKNNLHTRDWDKTDDNHFCCVSRIFCPHCKLVMPICVNTHEDNY